MQQALGKSNIKRITLLGSGTSTGVPEPGCYCRVCLSEDERDKRGRTSVLLETKDGHNVLLDCSPDFHAQCIGNGIDHIDAILLSHEHYDHIGGLDDLRTLAWHNSINIYAMRRVLESIRHRLHYYFGNNRYAGTPELYPIEIGERPFQLYGLNIVPITVMHGKLPILGFRIDDFVFLTDLKTIAPEELQKTYKPKLLFVNALRSIKPHPTHQTIEEAVALAEAIKADTSYLFHLSHHAPLTAELDERLPRDVHTGYDGLTLKYNDEKFVEGSAHKPSLREPQPYILSDLGIIDYEEALQKQESLFSEALTAKGKHQKPTNHFLFCEHNPVFTLGKHGNAQNLLCSKDWLEKEGIQLYQLKRGGDITYHGPGQLTGYPIFDLEQFGMGLKTFIHTMEECIIDLLLANGIKGERVPGATGVWIDAGTSQERKICAIGVYSSRYITMHGFALNVFTEMDYFRRINPCGFKGKAVTSMAQEMSLPTSIELVKQQLDEAFRRRFRQAMLAKAEKVAESSNILTT